MVTVKGSFALLFLFLSISNLTAQKTLGDSIMSSIKIEFLSDTFCIRSFKDSSCFIVVPHKKSGNNFKVISKCASSTTYKDGYFYLNCNADSLPNGIHVTTYSNGNLESAFYIEKNHREGFYYSFYNGKHLYLYCEYINGLEHGYKVYFSSKSPGKYFWIKSFNYGIVDGFQYEFFSRNGNITKMIFYKNGVKQGLQTGFKRSGKASYSASYLDGICTNTTVYRGNGGIKLQTYCYSNGKPYKTEYFKRNGKIKRIQLK